MQRKKHYHETPQLHTTSHDAANRRRPLLPGGRDRPMSTVWTRDEPGGGWTSLCMSAWQCVPDQYCLANYPELHCLWNDRSEQRGQILRSLSPGLRCGLRAAHGCQPTATSVVGRHEQRAEGIPGGPGCQWAGARPAGYHSVTCPSESDADGFRSILRRPSRLFQRNFQHDVRADPITTVAVRDEETGEGEFRSPSPVSLHTGRGRAPFVVRVALMKLADPFK